MPTDDRTSAVLSLVGCKLSLGRSVSDLLRDYRRAEPFPHLVLDHLFPADELHLVRDGFPQPSSEKWVNERNERFAKSNLRSAVYLAEYGYAFASMLHSAAFLYFMTEITGIQALLPDPYLSGAGYRVMEGGAKFEVHADTNHDGHCGLHRRLAMMIYLNQAWRPEFGGQLELWNQDATRCEKVIEPVFNRTVIMEIGDRNFHAVQPVASGSGAVRKSFMVYFHTVDGSIVPHYSIYAPSIYRDKDPWIRRVARGALPPVLWQGLSKLKSRRSRRMD
jgi:hypothetical protein